MDPSPPIRQGSIWMASVRDPRGNIKRRPVVILTATGEIVLDQPIVASAITSTFPDPPPADHVELPHSNLGHPATGLWKRSAAVATWLVEVRPSDLVELKGYLPQRTLLKLLKTLREFTGS